MQHKGENQGTVSSLMRNPGLIDMPQAGIRHYKPASAVSTVMQGIQVYVSDAARAGL